MGIGKEGFPCPVGRFPSLIDHAGGFIRRATRERRSACTGRLDHVALLGDASGGHDRLDDHLDTMPNGFYTRSTVQMSTVNE